MPFLFVDMAIAVIRTNGMDIAIAEIIAIAMFMPQSLQ